MTTTNQSIFQVALPQGNIAKYEKKKRYPGRSCNCHYLGTQVCDNCWYTYVYNEYNKFSYIIYTEISKIS